MMLKKFAYLGK